MALYMVKNNAAGGKTVKGSNALIVSAESAADAKVYAAAHFAGDSAWSDATAVELAGETWDASAAALGWTFKISITGGTQTEDPIEFTHVGAGTEDLDDVAAALVVLCNAHAEIASAAYSAPDLTVAAIGDGMGDATLRFMVYAPSGTSDDLSALLVGAGGITHEGIAAAVLEIALVADTEAKPESLDAFKV